MRFRPSFVRTNLFHTEFPSWINIFMKFHMLHNNLCCCCCCGSIRFFSVVLLWLCRYVLFRSSVIWDYMWRWLRAKVQLHVLSLSLLLMDIFNLFLWALHMSSTFAHKTTILHYKKKHCTNDGWRFFCVSSHQDIAYMKLGTPFISIKTWIANVRFLVCVMCILHSMSLQSKCFTILDERSLSEMLI